MLVHFGESFVCVCMCAFSLARYTTYFKMRSDWWKFDLLNSNSPFTCVTFQIHLKYSSTFYVFLNSWERIFRRPCACTTNVAVSIHSNSIFNWKFKPFSFFFHRIRLMCGKCCAIFINKRNIFFSLFHFSSFICHQSP